MADSSAYTPEDTARRIEMARALMAPPKQITHWAEGLNHLFRSYLGGQQLQDADRMQREGRADANAQVMAALGLGGPSAGPMPAVAPSAPAGTNAPMVAAPMGNKVAAAPIDKIYSNDESSPLDPPSGADRDKAIRTIVAEAGNQGPQGQNAVASVIRNRAVNGGFGGDTAGGVVTAPKQFEPWNDMSGRAKMAGIDPNSPAYAAAAKALDSAYFGNDPTNGATNFIAPKAQAALGRDMPGWAQGPGQDIGDHRFFGGKGDPVSGVAAALNNPQPAQGSPPAAAAGPAAPTNARAIAAVLSNPWVDPAMKHAVLAQANPSFGFQTLPDGTIVRTNPKSGTVEPIYKAETKPTFGVIGESEDGKKTYGFIDPVNKKVTALEPAKPGDDRPTVTGPDGKEIVIPKGVDVKAFKTEVTKATADAATGKKTEVQTKAEQFANRMEQSEATMSGGLDKQGTGVSGAAQQIAGSVPVVGSALQTKDYQKFEQAKSQFITALLRQESGAAIGKEEFKRYEKEFFPQPGDAAEVIAQKAQARKVAIEAMKKGAGPSYKPPDLAKPDAAKRVTKTVGGKNYYQENGQWFEE